MSKRITAARPAWHALGGWWRCKGVALRHRVAVFKVIVVSTLLSGLEPAVLTDTDLGRLESTQMKYLRVIAGALGCDRKPVEMSTSKAPNDPNIPAPYKYTAKSNFDIRALTGVGTVRSVLQQRRLKWLQQMAAHPADHKLVLAVVAGRLAADHTNAFNSNGCLATHAGPWACQWLRDLQALEVSTGHVILQPTGFWSIFDPCNDFHRIDVSHAQSYQDAREVSVGHLSELHACSLRTFVGHSKLSLQTHIAEKHNVRDPYKNAVVTNQCPFCLSIFKSKQTARQHVQQRSRKGICKQICRHPLAGHTTESSYRSSSSAHFVIILPRSCQLCKHTLLHTLHASVTFLILLCGDGGANLPTFTRHRQLIVWALVTLDLF